MNGSKRCSIIFAGGKLIRFLDAISSGRTYCMNNEGITITKVKQKLYKIPPDKLQEIDDFIDFVLTKTRSKPSRRIEKLEGIWKGLGFERILDLDESIREIRRDSEKSLLDRIAKCGT